MEPLTVEQQKALMSPLSKGRVLSRSQGGRSLSYLAAWDVKATLVRVFGFGGFDAEVVESKVLRMERDVPAFTGGRDNRTRKKDADGNPDFNWSVTTMSTVRLTIHQLGATYTETAIAGQTGPDVGEVADFAQKTSSSDALKRAAIYLGTQMGLSLYDDGSLSDVVRVVLAPGQAWRDGARTDAVEAEVDQGEAAQEVTGTSTLTPEQRAENEELLTRAVSMKKAQGGE